MSRTIRIWASLATLIVASACASARPTQSPEPASAASTNTAPPHRMMMSGDMPGAGNDGMPGRMMGGMCPMKVAGTSVAISYPDGGVALTFTTTSSSDRDELRRRVQRMAEMHERRGMMGHSSMRPHAGMMADEPMPDATVSKEDVDGGARLVFKPKDPAQLEALREHVRRGPQHMRDGTCPMAEGSAEATPPR